MIILLFFMISIANAGPLDPIFSPLGIKQQENYILAAPSGEDKPLEIPVVVEPPEPPIEEKPSTIEETVAENLAPISLEARIQQQIVQSNLSQFGYDLFNKGKTSLLSYIPIPPDYILAPGDTIIIQLYGKTNVEYTLVIQREGDILIPEIGPMKIAGLSFEAMKQLVINKIKTQKFGVEVAITIGEIRTIQVFMVGEVIKPGAYTINGLTTLIQFLLSSPGIQRSGSLRNIQVRRYGKVIAILDLYHLLLQGDTTADIPLRHGDIIFIPTLGSTISVAGEVQRPAIYELKNEKTIEEAISLAGGYLPTAQSGKIHIERIIPGQGQTLIDINSDNPADLNTVVKNGDIIRIFPVPKQMDKVVLVLGPILEPGGYQYHKGMRIADIIHLDKLLTTTDQNIALLRQEHNKKVSVRYINLYQALQNPYSKENYRLKPRDQIILFNLQQPRAQQTENIVSIIKTQAQPSTIPPAIVTVKGQTRYQGTFPLDSQAKLLDVLAFAGGILEDADKHYGIVVRKQFPQDTISFISSDIDKALNNPNSPENLVIFPQDTIYILPENQNRANLLQKDLDILVQQTPYGEASKIVFAEGDIRIPGRYPMEPGMRIDDLLRAAGGLIEESYGLEAEVTRYILDQEEFRVAEHITIDLDKVLAGEIQENIILHPHDRLVLHKKPQWKYLAAVTLQGEVTFPGKYPIYKQETLCEVIHRAGGFTDQAYLFASVFTRKSVQKEQQAALDRIREDMDDLLAQIHLSPSVENSDKMPAGELKHRIIETIRTLEKAKASGRMVIDVEDASYCKPGANITLEDGDNLFIPSFKHQVHVVGEVYYPTSHNYRSELTSKDYVDLSGGTTVLARKDHIYVVQANGEVFSIRGGDWSNTGRSVTITPGATIYVPLNVDRINNREAWQSWTQIAYQLAVAAASLRFVFGGF